MKNYNRVYGLVVVFFGYFFHELVLPVQALVKVPLCDLVGDSCKINENGNNAVVYYNNLSLCGQRIKNCPRIHQLLFNEIVTILEEKGDECLVKVPSIFYEREDRPERYDTYWALRKNFITFEALSQLGIAQTIFPDPLQYERTGSMALPSNKKIVVLQVPYYDQKTKQHYSAGTRFVLSPLAGNRCGYTVYLFDASTNKCITTVIPHGVGTIENSTEPVQKKIAQYVTLLRRWTQHKGFIPYVWGGASCINYCFDDSFSLVKTAQEEFFQRDECLQSPKSGFDCAGLIARAAQICGLPYYYKNSITIKKNLTPVRHKEHLREGDIIWIPGHVMVVASLKNNTLIEARGYNHGYGKVHEIAVDKVFQGIDTFGQLIDCYNARKPVQRLDRKGAVAHRVDAYFLLSFESGCR